MIVVEAAGGAATAPRHRAMVRCSEQDQSTGKQLQDRATELQTNRASGTGDEHKNIDDARTEQLRHRRLGSTADQVFNGEESGVNRVGPY